MAHTTMTSAPQRPPPVSPHNPPTADLAHWREALLHTMLGVSVPLGLFLTVIGTSVAYYKQDVAMGLTNVVGLGALLVARYAPAIALHVRAVVYLLIVAGVGVSFLFNQIGAFGLVWLSTAPLLGALLMGRRVATALLLAISLGVFSMAWAFDMPIAPLPLKDHPALMWALLGMNFLALNLMVAISAAVLLRHLDWAISQATESQAVLKQQAELDHLTGLPNRRALHERLHRLLSTEGNASHPKGALLFIDVDNFKDVNDTYGHIEGDRLLVEMAKRLSAHVSPPALVARMGGDEFVVLVQDAHPHPADTTADLQDQIMALANGVREAMEKRFAIASNLAYHTSVSIGVSLVNHTTGTPDDVMREADTALYQAKNRGRNQVVFFEPSMHAAVHERMQLEHDLAHALRHGDLHVVVQSQVNGHGTVVGAELLARWQHPQRGLVPPSQFIPLAEQTGLIVQLGEFMLEQACVLSVRLRNAGHKCPLSVNISARQFRQPGFERHLHKVLAHHQVDPALLVLEVTESLMVTDQLDTIASMSRLAAQGFKFSMDDFGTGYSSLNYLKRLPLYELKIDRSFVDDLPHDANDVAIVTMILAMAQTLKLQVVAEGVETTEQSAFLLAHGCQSLQGYLYSRPAPADAWLASLG